jgi:alpha-mannosidase
VLEYALRFDADELDDAALLRESQDYRRPFLVLPQGVEFDPPMSLGGDVVFSCLKGAEDGDGLIVRVFNPGAAETTACLSGPFAVQRARLDESGGAPLPDGIVEVRPGAIATLRVSPAD